MIIREFFIDGFGVFAGAEVKGLNPGLNVFLGANEAGKSTLLAFFRTLFFGFARKGDQDDYPALAGGRLGGRLVIEHPERGLVTVSRLKEKTRPKAEIFFEDGSRGGEDDLRGLLSGLTAPLYKNVYAFSLSELSDLKGLSEKEVREALFGASFGVGVLSLPKAFKQLEDGMGKIFRPGGSAASINMELSALAETRSKIARAMAEQDRYGELVRRIEKDEATLAELSDLERTLGRRKSEAEIILKLWEDWQDYRDAEERLAALAPLAAAFPENGREDFSRLAEKRENVRSELRKALLERESLAFEDAALAVDEGLLRNASEVGRLVRGLSAYKEDVRLAEALSRDAAQKGREAEALCGGLGPGWTPERAAATDLSLFTRQGLDRLGQALEKSLAALEKARENANSRSEAAERAAEAEREAKLRVKETEEAAPGGDDPAETAARLRRYRALLGEAALLEGEARHAEKLERDLASGSAPAWAIAVAFLAVVVSAALLWRAAGPPSAVAFLVAAALFAGVLLLNGRKRAALKRRALEDAARAAERLESARRDLAEMRLLLGGGDLDALEEELFRGREARAASDGEIKRAREALEGAQKERGRVEVEAAAALASARKAEADTIEARNAWEAWLAELGLPAGLLPGTARDALSLIENAARLAREADRLEGEARGRREKIASFETEATALLEACGLEIEAEGGPEAALLTLEGLCRKDSEARVRKDANAKALARLDRAVASLRENEEGAGEGIRRLLAAAGAGSEEDFPALARRFEERRELAAKKENAARNLRRISGETDFPALCIRLSRLSREGVESGLSEIRAGLEGAAERRDGLHRNLADLRSRRAALVSGEELSLLRVEEEARKETIRLLSREWARSALARELLSEAKRRFEEREQPEVIRRAEAHFRVITGGAYTRLYAQAGEGEIEAQDQKGERKGPEALSRGSAEQLYLCLRLSHAEMGARRHGGPPLVMDDVLVNFDAVRAEATARVITEVSSSMQIFFFTCHEKTAERLAAAPGAAFFRILSGRIEGSASPSAA